MKPPVFKSNFSRLNHKGQGQHKTQRPLNPQTSLVRKWAENSTQLNTWKRKDDSEVGKNNPVDRATPCVELLPGKWITQGTADMCPAKCQNLCRPGTTM